MREPTRAYACIARAFEQRRSEAGGKRGAVGYADLPRAGRKLTCIPLRQRVVHSELSACPKEIKSLGYRVLILACNQLPLCSFWFGPIVRERERTCWGHLRHEMRGCRLKDGDNALEYGAKMRHPWVTRVNTPR